MVVHHFVEAVKQTNDVIFSIDPMAFSENAKVKAMGQKRCNSLKSDMKDGFWGVQMYFSEANVFCNLYNCCSFNKEH